MNRFLFAVCFFTAVISFAESASTQRPGGCTGDEPIIITNSSIYHELKTPREAVQACKAKGLNLTYLFAYEYFPESGPNAHLFDTDYVNARALLHQSFHDANKTKTSSSTATCKRQINETHVRLIDINQVDEPYEKCKVMFVEGFIMKGMEFENFEVRWDDANAKHFFICNNKFQVPDSELCEMIAKRQINIPTCFNIKKRCNVSGGPIV